MAHTSTIAVDFDGCICEHAFPDCGEPRADVIELLFLLRERGWRIIIHSCRANSDWIAKGATIDEAGNKVNDMLSYLRRHHVPFDSLWGIDIAGSIWTYSGVSGKPVADVYLDDRAVCVQPSLPTNVAKPYLFHRLVYECERIVNAGGDPLHYHRKPGRKVD